MAWVQSNTFTITSTQTTWHDFFVYLFDTFLPTITGFTVSAHPDASTFKRKFTYTFANNTYDNNPLTCYHWATWSNDTGPTDLRLYYDLDYSVTPGDTSNLSSIAGWAGVGSIGTSWIGTYRFWKTTTNSRAFLITHGNTPWMFWPGYANLRTWGDPTVWAGTYQTREQTHPSVLWGSPGAQSYYGSPRTYGSTQLGDFMPISVPGRVVSPDVNYLVRDPMMVFNTSGTDPDDTTLPGMWGGTEDFGILRNPITEANNDFRMYMSGVTVNNGILYLVNGTDYWLRRDTSNDYLGHAAFYFGTSQPDLSI